MNKPEAKRILNEVLGYFKESGQELLFKCPSCNHHKRKLSVNLDKNAFKCWICDYRGRNLRRLVRRYGSYVQLSKWDKITNRFDLANFADLFMDQSDREEEIKVELPQEFRTLTSKDRPLISNPAFRYLRERGLSKDDILKWKIGYCYEGQYRNRIIIPSFNDVGDTNYFIARSYSGDSYKYKNPRASKNIVFNELFIDWDQDLVIVEGVFDAIVAGNAVPILGSTLRADSRLIQKIVYNDTPVYIALDPDAEAKERKIIQTLLKYDIELYKIDVSGYEDVGSMPKEIFERRKQQASFIDNDNYLLMNLLMAI
jgi:transcription elongation factor Elf1